MKRGRRRRSCVDGDDCGTGELSRAEIVQSTVGGFQTVGVAAVAVGGQIAVRAGVLQDFLPNSFR